MAKQQNKDLYKEFPFLKKVEAELGELGVVRVKRIPLSGVQVVRDLPSQSDEYWSHALREYPSPVDGEGFLVLRTKSHFPNDTPPEITQTVIFKYSYTEEDYLALVKTKVTDSLRKLSSGHTLLKKGDRAESIPTASAQIPPSNKKEDIKMTNVNNVLNKEVPVGEVASFNKMFANKGVSTPSEDAYTPITLTTPDKGIMIDFASQTTGHFVHNPVVANIRGKDIVVGNLVFYKTHKEPEPFTTGKPLSFIPNYVEMELLPHEELGTYSLLKRFEAQEDETAPVYIEVSIEGEPLSKPITVKIVVACPSYGKPDVEIDVVDPDAYLPTLHYYKLDLDLDSHTALSDQHVYTVASMKKLDHLDVDTTKCDNRNNPSPSLVIDYDLATGKSSKFAPLGFSQSMDTPIVVGFISQPSLELITALIEGRLTFIRSE